ncbi:acyl carrier protein [Hymenobacter volaticus]|uniref:Acyl carrier protein n=1 Tax=Hymenobacter volaticus TaxID=2932254 RepID=A0ABY4GAV0_9BACT|nr:acyl carrier protein [Hymenobacter volaticus]UOQ68037.1 acyl carrier protein [Hymenobacter volaticus]
MISIKTFASKSIIQLTLRLVSQYKTADFKQLSLNLQPSRETGLDLLDFIDCLLDLEDCFHVPVPDELPLFTIGDLLNYLATSLHLRLPF